MTDSKDQRDAAVNNAISQIEKQFGKGSIMRLGSENVVNVPAISTGCLSLDIITGIGGFPRGRMIEVYGPEASGKTTIALQAIAEAQKAGGNAAFMPRSWVSILMSCMWPNPIMESRHLRLRRYWYVREVLILL